MANIIGAITTSTCPPSAARSPARCSRTLLEALLRRLHPGARVAGRGQARHRRGALQRPRAELLPRQDADLRGRRRARVPQRRRRLGHPDRAGLQGRPGPVLAPDRIADGEDFDLTTCQEMQVDHAFTLPMALLWPDQNWPVRWCRCASTPCSSRCPARPAATSWARPSAARWRASRGRAGSLVLGTGGLSHQLDGERAGFINKDFDLQFMESLTGTDPSC
jgi:hypothetical protein